MRYSVEKDDRVKFKIENLRVSGRNNGSEQTLAGYGMTAEAARRDYINQMEYASDAGLEFSVDGTSVPINVKLLTAQHPGFNTE